jgi:hypothetical protein
MILTIDLIKEYLSHQVESGIITFGWYDDIKDYDIKDYIEFNGYVKIECEYSNVGKVYTKLIETKTSNILSYNRDKKIKILGI